MMSIQSLYPLPLNLIDDCRLMIKDGRRTGHQLESSRSSGLNFENQHSPIDNHHSTLTSTILQPHAHRV